ncbi:hypothetical protein [Haliangium ochraceum]|uniref:Uncharacterized protein n=1 Tax=Haliangium ochraceum (strain DSM 14365 / JCM 11303 / SMP-2) TaxID=502025 RepID=D0LVV5_HALO1|nr:hypothetical protein [Haliangium ochraceum]ACY14089.1 hypothetical protein Hoch_1537 [Haliangium ochraceum DSM 14365]
MSISAQIRVGTSEIGGAVHVRVARSMGATAGMSEIVVPGPIELGAAPGDEVAVQISEEDSPVTVFTGTLDSFEATSTHVLLRAFDSRVQAARLRVNRIFEDQASDIIVRDLAGEVGVTVGSLAEGATIKSYWAHDGRSVLGHMVHLSALSSAHLFVNGEGTLTTIPYAPSSPTLQLRHGEHLIAARAAKREGGGEVEVRTEGAASSDGDSAAYWPTTDTASVAGIGVMGDAGAPELWWIPELRAMDSATGAANGRALFRAQNTECTRVTCLGLLDVELGDAVTVTGVPSAIADALGLVVALEHVLGPSRGFLTTLRLMGAGG